VTAVDGDMPNATAPIPDISELPPEAAAAGGLAAGGLAAGGPAGGEAAGGEAAGGEAATAEPEVAKASAAVEKPQLTETAPDQAGVDRTERTETWAKLVADPGHAPELLALAAVEIFGPRANAWATRTRESYPTASNQALARLATRQFTRFGSLGSIFGAIVGSYPPITLLGTAAITHAELALHLAAAYGVDPTDPARAAELLVITRVHPTLAEAEAALAAARRPAYEDGGLTGAARRLGRMLATQTGGWTALRLANRYFPGTSLLAAVLTSTASAQSVAARADKFYRS
jgi:hypothetical protein